MFFSASCSIHFPLSPASRVTQLFWLMVLLPPSKPSIASQMLLKSHYADLLTISSASLSTFKDEVCTNNPWLTNPCVLFNFPIAGDNTLHPQLKGGEFNLAHILKGVSPWSSGSKAETSWERNVTKQSCSVDAHWEAEQSNSISEKWGKTQIQDPMP